MKGKFKFKPIKKTRGYLGIEVVYKKVAEFNLGRRRHRIYLSWRILQSTSHMNL